MSRSGIDKLTQQERACLRLVPLRNTAEIARLTGLSPETVKTYLRRAREKLDVTRTAAAARLLIEADSCPLERGSSSRVTDAEGSDLHLMPPQRPARSAPVAVQEERTGFSYAHERREPQEEEGAAYDRQWLNTLLKIAALVAMIAVIILLADPLSQSAQKLANLISPP